MDQEQWNAGEPRSRKLEIQHEAVWAGLHCYYLGLFSTYAAKVSTTLVSLMSTLQSPWEILNLRKELPIPYVAQDRQRKYLTPLVYIIEFVYL